MNIQMIGIDHSLASVDVRALFAFTKAGAVESMTQLCKDPLIHGVIILSTCNRMELWIHAEEGRELPLYDILCRLKKIDSDIYRDNFVVRRGEDAVRHLFRMTSGLKSLILGEDQILTQVKDALQLSHDSYCTDSVLETLFRMAVTGAKKVKGSMQRSMTNVSAIEQAVVWLKHKQNMEFNGKKCVVIGNGEMGKRAALAFLGEGADVTVTVRQYRSGVVQIPSGCKRINYGDRYELIPECDFVVSATSSPNLTLKAEDIRMCAADREQIYIDLAVPRDIDPGIGCMEGKQLFTIDDFAVVESAENEMVIRHAEDTLEEQIAEFTSWYNGRDMIPRVKQIGSEMAQEAYWRTGKTVKKLSLDMKEEQMLHEAVVTAADKVIQKMLFTIRNEAGMDVFRACLDALTQETEKHE